MKPSFRAIVIFLSLALLGVSFVGEMQGPFEISSERYAAQSRTRRRDHGTTGTVAAVTSIPRRHRAMLPISKPPIAQPLLQVGRVCDRQRQRPARISNNLT